ncbi:MAG: ABC transporter ATP-binding protein [Bacillota bacterium]|nr:ABC transporter ATP-binding protein [Bacillota bacterium]
MLALTDVRVNYGSVRALKSISLEVREGEIVTLIGANGAGKTTTLKAISGLARPASGRIVFDSVDITRMRPASIVSLGISQVPEGRRVFPRMTVLENLEMGAFRRRDRQRVREDLDTVFGYFPILKERLSQPAGTLSGGEQQMLAIGRGLMARPRLLLLDEPSLGLAPMLVEQIFDIIKRIHDEGVTILLVEQNAFLALETASRAYVLETGEIALQGAARDLMQDEHVKRAYLG